MSAIMYWPKHQFPPVVRISHVHQELIAILAWSRLVKVLLSSIKMDKMDKDLTEEAIASIKDIWDSSDDDIFDTKVFRSAHGVVDSDIYMKIEKELSLLVKKVIDHEYDQKTLDTVLDVLNTLSAQAKGDKERLDQHIQKERTMGPRWVVE